MSRYALHFVSLADCNNHDLATALVMFGFTPMRDYAIAEHLHDLANGTALFDAERLKLHLHEDVTVWLRLGIHAGDPKPRHVNAWLELRMNDRRIVVQNSGARKGDLFIWGSRTDSSFGRDADDLLTGVGCLTIADVVTPDMATKLAESVPHLALRFFHDERNRRFTFDLSREANAGEAIPDLTGLPSPHSAETRQATCTLDRVTQDAVVRVLTSVGLTYNLEDTPIPELEPVARGRRLLDPNPDGWTPWSRSVVLDQHFRYHPAGGTPGQRTTELVISGDGGIATLYPEGDDVRMELRPRAGAHHSPDQLRDLAAASSSGAMMV